MNELKRKYYHNEILKISRGNSHGVFINAKPLYLLSLIYAIQDRVITENVITFPNKALENVYITICETYESHKKATPFLLPYFHLSRCSYYHIEWKGEPFKQSPRAHTPSAKYLKDNVNYAYLYYSLWDLLQYPEVREEYKQLIIDFFFET
jgi:predicted restriction endonuclease